MFGEDLEAVYRSIYELSKHSNLPPDYIESISPVERQLMYSFLMEEFADTQENSAADDGGFEGMAHPEGGIQSAPQS